MFMRLFPSILWYFKNIFEGLNLTLQQLRFHASIAGGRDLIPGQRTKIPYAVQYSQKKKKERILKFRLKCILGKSCLMVKCIKEILHSVNAFCIWGSLVLTWLLCFLPLTDWALWEPDRAFCPVQRRAADGQCPHDSGRTVLLPHVCFLGWSKRWRYII